MVVIQVGYYKDTNNWLGDLGLGGATPGMPYSVGENDFILPGPLDSPKRGVIKHHPQNLDWISRGECISLQNSPNLITSMR